MVDFTIDGTIDGSQYIFGPNRNIFTRIFWIFLFIFSIFGLFYYIRSSYTKWLLEPDIITKTRIRTKEEFPPFAFTFCPQVFDTDSFKIAKLDEKYKNGEAVSREECNVIKAYKKFCDIYTTEGEKYFEGLKEFSENCTQTISNHSPSNWSEIASILLKTHEAFVNLSTRFKHNYLPTSYRTVLTSLGACTSFNMINKSIFKEKWMDDAQGLMKKGEVESNWTSDSNMIFPKPYWHPKDVVSSFSIFKSDYDKCANSNNATFKLFIHQADQFPTFMHDTLEVEYGKGTKFSIKTKSQRANENLRILDPEVRKCYFDDERELKYFKRYSKYYCQLECKMKEQECDPLEIPMVRTSNRTICPAQEWLSVMEYRYTQKCKCYPSCNRLEFQVKSDEAEKQNSTHVLFVHDLDASIHVEETERFMTYTLINFVADIGGYLGLFLGCSILSIIEIFFYLSAKILNKMRKRQTAEAQSYLADEIQSIKRELEKLHQERNKEDIESLISKAIRLELVELQRNQKCSCRENSVKTQQSDGISKLHQELQDLAVEDMES